MSFAMLVDEMYGSLSISSVDILSARTYLAGELSFDFSLLSADLSHLDGLLAPFLSLIVLNSDSSAALGESSF